MAHTQSTVSVAYRLLEGTWVNQLGSEVRLEPDAGGGLRGEYCGAAGSLAGRTYPVVGSYEHDSIGRTMPLAFLVSWTEAHCVTSWCGHFIPSEDRIELTWLMATEERSSDEWKSTVIGHDVFHRRT